MKGYFTFPKALKPGASPLDVFVSYLRHSLGKVSTLYIDAVSVFYSLRQLGWLFMIQTIYIYIYICYQNLLDIHIIMMCWCCFWCFQSLVDFKLNFKCAFVYWNKLLKIQFVAHLNLTWAAENLQLKLIQLEHQFLKLYLICKIQLCIKRHPSLPILVYFFRAREELVWQH